MNNLFSWRQQYAADCPWGEEAVRSPKTRGPCAHILTCPVGYLSCWRLLSTTEHPATHVWMPTMKNHTPNPHPKELALILALPSYLTSLIHSAAVRWPVLEPSCDFCIHSSHIQVLSLKMDKGNIVYLCNAINITSNIWYNYKSFGPCWNLFGHSYRGKILAKVSPLS